MDDKQLAKLNQNIQQLTRRIERQNSVWQSFMLSILRGVGNFIGFTIVASILLYIASLFLRTIDIPILHELQEIVGMERVEELRVEKNWILKLNQLLFLFLVLSEISTKT